MPGQSGNLQGKLVFLPEEPLHAHTQYHASARVRDPLRELLSDPTSFTFQTGDTRLDPLSTTSSPNLESEWYDAPALQCDRGKLVGDAVRSREEPTICPGPYSHYSDCRPADPERALRYHLTLAPSGGDDRLPYTVEMLLTDHDHGRFQGPYSPLPLDEGSDPNNHAVWEHRQLRVPAGETAELSLDVPMPSDPTTKLCVRWRVSDVSGKVLSANETCQTRAALEQEADVDTIIQAPSDAALPEAAEAGCSLGACRDGADAGVVPLLLAGLLWQRRRRAEP